MIESRLTPGKDITCYRQALSQLTFSTVINRTTSFVTLGQGDPWRYELYVHGADTTSDDVAEMTFHLDVFAINDAGLRAVGSWVDTIIELAHHLDEFNHILHHRQVP